MLSIEQPMRFNQEHYNVDDIINILKDENVFQKNTASISKPDQAVVARFNIHKIKADGNHSLNNAAKMYDKLSTDILVSKQSVSKHRVESERSMKHKGA